MNIVSWNCRGLENSSKVEVVNNLIRMASPDVLLLQETKIDKDNLLSLSKKSWNKNVGLVVSAHGSAGGLALVVKEPFLSVKLSYNAALDFFELRHLPSMISFALFNLYLPVNLLEKRECWNSLNDFIVANSPFKYYDCW